MKQVDTSRESVRLAPAVVFGPAGRKQGEKVAMQAKFVPRGFFVLTLHLEEHRAEHAVCMRSDGEEMHSIQEPRLF